MHPINSTGNRDIKKAKSFLESSPMQQEEIISTFIEQAQTVTLNVGELKQLSLSELGKYAFEWNIKENSNSNA